MNRLRANDSSIASFASLKTHGKRSSLMIVLGCEPQVHISSMSSPPVRVSVVLWSQRASRPVAVSSDVMSPPAHLFFIQEPKKECNLVLQHLNLGLLVLNERHRLVDFFIGNLLPTTKGARWITAHAWFVHSNDLLFDWSLLSRYSTTFFEAFTKRS